MRVKHIFSKCGGFNIYFSVKFIYCGLDEHEHQRNWHLPQTLIFLSPCLVENIKQ